MFNTLLQAAPEQPAGAGIMSFLPFILIIVVFYFFMIRPQQKRQKELNKFRDALKKGDKVITTGGIYATVVKVNDNKVDLMVANDVVVTFDKAAIASSVENNAEKN